MDQRFPEFRKENLDKYDNNDVAIIMLNLDPALATKAIEAVKRNTIVTPESKLEILIGHTSKYKKLYDRPIFEGCQIFDLQGYHFSLNNNYLVTQTKAKTLIFLNDDCFVQPGWLPSMLADLNQEEVGLVGAKLLFPNETIQHAGVFFVNTLEFGTQPRHPGIGSPDLPKFNGKKEVPCVTGAFIGIRHSLFDAIGGFDERFQLELQDVHLSVKVWAYGKKVIYDPIIVAYHLTAESRQETNIYNVVLSDRKLLVDTSYEFCKEKGFIIPYESNAEGKQWSKPMLNEEVK